MHRSYLHFACALALVLCCAQSSLAQDCTITQSLRVRAANPGPGEQFGSAVDLAGGVCLAGAPSPQSSTNDGLAFLFSTADGTPLLEFAPSGVSYTGPDRFGAAVSLDLGVAVVGAPGDYFGRGAVYLFDSLTGQLLHKLSPTSLAVGDSYGNAVDKSVDRLIVGAYAHDAGTAPGQANSGAAFVHDSATGQLLMTLKSSTPQTGDFFGHAVALRLDFAAVGAPRDDDFGTTSGTVFLFDIASGQQTGLLHASDAGADQEFGYSVAIGGTRVLVGARGDAENGTNSGAAYLFDAASGVEIAKLLPPDGRPNDRFGTSVAVAGPIALVGAPGHAPHTPSLRTGAAYAYSALTGEFIAMLAAPFGSDQDQLGQSVALDTAQRAAIGAPRGDTNPFGTNNAGFTYVFPVGRPNATAYCLGASCPCGNDDADAGCINSTQSGATLEACGTTSLTSDDLFLLGSGLPPDQYASLLLSSGQQQLPLGDGVLCLASPLRFPQIFTVEDGTLSIGSGLGWLSCATFGQTGCITPLSTWNFQVWYRDSNSICSSNSNLTNAVEVSFVP